MLVGDRWTEVKRFFIDLHEAAYVLNVSCATAGRMLQKGALLPGAVGDMRSVDVGSVVVIAEGLVRDGAIDKMSLTLLHDVISGRRRIPMAAVKARPRRGLLSEY
jgi:hypothetical protein